MSKTIKINGSYSVKVVPAHEARKVISKNDAEMDRRAREAVRTAIAKAEFCEKPIAKYDKINKQAYIENMHGVREYVK